MDSPPRGSSPSSRILYDPNSNCQRMASTLQTHHPISPPNLPRTSSRMIPNGRQGEAPPPLPPPRHPESFANTYDVAFHYLNKNGNGRLPSAMLAPIDTTSSLAGAGWEIRTAMSKTKELYGRAVAVSDVEAGTTSTTSSQDSLLLGPRKEGRPKSPASITNSRLHSDQPLAQQSHKSSSEAYDKHLLSKIGKNSPPRRSSQGSGDINSGLGRSLRPTDGGNNLHRLSMADTSMASFDPVSRSMASPASGGLSPAVWRESIDFRSGSVDSSAPSSAVDQDYYPRLRDHGKHSTGPRRAGNDDSISLPSRAPRGGYDQQLHPSEAEVDVPMEETENLNLGDRTPSHNSYAQPYSKQQGQKRRALTRRPETGRHVKPLLGATNQVGEPSQRPGTGSVYSLSPASHLPKHGSVSSISSIGPRTGSHTSSVGFSAAGSSMTSISSTENKYSPGGASPPSDLEANSEFVHPHQKSHNSSLKPHIAPARSSSYQSTDKAKSTGTFRVMSSQIPSSEGKVPETSRIGGQYFICECCSKKPKKFSTEDDLRVHMNEKQYKCAYCPNRFKNKNEAERHQNSLHLRHHSWFCAAISGHEAAFHPSPSSSPQSPAAPSTDACGYCGDEFTNYPVNWQARYDHLTNEHKFGECNQTKKFYRADHFRQHLKHSHAGTSGKWTNMLENACMKEEAGDTETIQETRRAESIATC